MLCSCQDWKDWIYSKTSSKEFLKRYVPYPWLRGHVSMRHWPCLLNYVYHYTYLDNDWDSNVWMTSTHDPMLEQTPLLSHMSNHSIELEDPSVMLQFHLSIPEFSNCITTTLQHCMRVWSGLGRSCPLAIHFVKWKFCILLPIQLQTIKDWHLWNGSANCAR